MRVTKMHGLGNDYIFHRPAEERDWEDVRRRISDRHFGVGSDGLILALPSDKADLRMRMFNADGSEAEMCGNGIRCLGKVRGRRGHGRPPTRSSSPSKPELACSSLNSFAKTASSPPPAWTWARRASTPQRSLPTSKARARSSTCRSRSMAWSCRLTLVSMGNPHAIHYIESGIESFPLERIGPLVENHPLFPRRTNFQVVQVLDRGHVRHRVWERGSGITLASGTSASAVAAASRLRGFTGDRIVDSLPGGRPHPRMGWRRVRCS